MSNPTPSRRPARLRPSRREDHPRAPLAQREPLGAAGPQDHQTAPQPPNPWPMRTVRYILPAVVTLAGVIVMCMGSEIDLEGGASIVSAGLAIYFINWLYRIGVSGDRQREREAEARDYFDRHGRWPN